MAFERYLAEEIGVDHAAGLLTRREALRRLAVLGLSAATASSVLAACAQGSSPESREAGPAGVTTSGTSGPAAPPSTQAIEYRGPQGRTLQGAWAPAAGRPRGAVLVIHENRGLTDHIRSVASRLARDGYPALAVDLLSEEGGTGAFDDPAAVMAALSRIPRERFVTDLQAGVTELTRRAPGAKPGAVGFCFGGGMTWLMIANEPRLAAAAPFYGPFPQDVDFSRARAAVFAVYAERDERVNASRNAARAALDRAGVPHEIVTYPDADHAFFNDTGPRYQPRVAQQAYERLLGWFGRYLAP